MALKVEAKEQDAIRRYLLGQLPQEESARLEERLLSDSDVFEELLITEDELIDQYLAGDLSPAARPGFETHFLATPERQQKVRFARRLKKYVGEATATKSQADHEVLDPAQLSTALAKTPPKKRPFFSFLPANTPILSYSLAAAVVLVVVSVSWIVIKNWRSTQPNGTGKVLAVVLTTGTTRSGGEIPRILITPGVDTVELRLEVVKSDHTSYRAILLADDRSEVWSRDDLMPTNVAGATFILANIPASLLADGDYRLRVSRRSSDGSFEDIGTYNFRVTH